MRIVIKTLCLLILILASTTGQALAVTNEVNTSPRLLRVHPMADARWVPVSTGLTFHFSEAVRPGSIRITLIGSEGGVYQASIQATRDNRTLVAHPTRPFAMNETVTVTLAGTNGMRRTWSFHTVPRAIPDDVIARMDEAMLEEFTNPEPTRKSSEDRSFPWRSLDETETVVPPVTMPEFEVTNPGGASDGVVYVQAFNYPTSGSERFNFVLSNEGDLLYYESFIEQIPFDFHPHDNVSRIHYFIYPDRQIHVMDTTWTIVDTITAENGYRLDPHECLLIEDGSYWLIAQDIRIVDMSEVVEGGDEEASVIGMVVQHVDADQNVLFEWRSLDHIPVTDADLVYVDLTEEYIDYCHTNSIELDSDTSLVISSRNISEATRISRETGDVLWRLSGTGNQFEFVDDPNPGFAIQHDARILDNGHLTIFNNGGHEFDAISSVKEYELDTEAMTARLVWSYQNDELGTIGWKMGSARRMPNGNTLIGWGAARNNRPYYPIASEIDMEGNVLWQLDFAEEGSGDLISYRAYRSSIRGRAAKPYLYALWYGDDADVWLNYFGHEETSSFRLSYGIRGSGTSETVTTDEGYLSLTDLDPDEEYELTMVALDGEGGESEVSNTVYIHWNENDVADEKPGELPATITLHDVWPNPFNATTTAQIELGRTSEVQMSLVNLLGREVTMLNQGRMSAGVHRLSIGGEHLASGVYFLRVVSQGEVVGTRKLVLLR